MTNMVNMQYGDEVNVTDLVPFFSKIASGFKKKRGFLPCSISHEDLVQEAITIALELLPKFKANTGCSFTSYIYRYVTGRFSQMMAESHFGPKASTRCAMVKRGAVIDYGEVSLESFGNWEEWISKTNDTDTKVVSFYHIPLGKGGECLQEIRDKIKSLDDAGIYWNNQRNKWNVEVRCCGIKQFVGIFKEKEDARKAKKKFLEDFFDLALDSITETEIANVAVCSVWAS